MTPRICLSLYGTTDALCDDIMKHPEADLCEIRLDLSGPLDLQRIRQTATRPLILASHSRPELLNDAAPFADYLDVGPGAPRDARSIVSVHAASGDPQALWKTYSGDHLTKIVLETENYYTIRSLLELNRRRPGRSVCFAMGEVGSFSRILSAFEGAPWIYASLDGRPTAPGQFTLRELIDTYRLPRFTAKPFVIGIVGDPVAHSRSPAFHNAKFAESAMPWIYVPLLCRDIRALFACAPDFGMTGFSITHPYKEAVLPFLDDASEEVQRLRSCNTVCFRDGRWHGVNTDVVGIQALLRNVPLQDARMVVLGAGSSARAVASVARPHVRELHILNRTREKAERLAAEYDASTGILQDLAALEYDILFQTTPMGMNEGECPVEAPLRPGAFVIDALYHPVETELLRRARAIGCRTLNGESWFLTQAEAQYQWWRGMIPG